MKNTTFLLTIVAGLSMAFTGQVDGDVTGFIENGKKEGSWTYFHSNIETRFFKDQNYFS